MVNSGLLEFSDDQKVRVDINAETGKVVKAVTIDADDVETPICNGGGDNDFTTANVTFKNVEGSNGIVTINAAVTYVDEISGEGHTESLIKLEPNFSVPAPVVLYKGNAIAMFSPATAQATLEGDAVNDAETGGIRITGDCVISFNVPK